MSVIVGPEFEKKTHHVSLSDGTYTVGLMVVNARGEADPSAIGRAAVPRTALKTTSGDQKYSDYEPPWSPVSQDDFTGGMGLLDDSDTTRYWDGFRCNTAYSGGFFLGPQETYATGLRSEDRHLPGSVTWTMLGGGRTYMAVSFTASANYSATAIALLLRRVGTPTTDVTIELCANSAGNPGAVYASATVSTTDITDVISRFYHAAVTAYGITSGTVYWIKVYSTGGDTDNHWEVGVENASGSSKQSSDGTTWSSSAIDLYYRVTPASDEYSTIFFRFRRAMYALRSKTGTVKLYMNGDRGFADANTGQLTKLIDATKAWTTNEWAGCVAVVIAGTGSTELKPWRLISSNDATSLTVDSAWLIEHDTTTEYVILGSNKWTEVASTGLTQPIYSRDGILVYNDIVYFCQGDSTNIRRMKYDSAGYTWADDGTNKATFMVVVRDQTNGPEIWRANNKDASGFRSVSKASVVAWGTNLTFGAATDTTFKDEWGNITGLMEWGETSRLLYIFMEGTLYGITDGKPDEIPLSEIHTAMAYTNGRAHTGANVYMYFNLGNGLERYYNRQMDDSGPDRDDGLPDDRQGIISALLGYPGQLFAVVDGGSENYSSLLVHNGTGWNELYRAPMEGLRITHLAFQTIPGTLSRLWLNVDDDIIWLPFPDSSRNPTKDSEYRFTHEAALTSSYQYVGLYDIYKMYHSLKLFTEGLVEDEQIVHAEYQVDDETTWHCLPEEFYLSPMDEKLLTEELGVNGKRLRYRLRLLTNDNSKTPVVKGTVLDTISRVPIKYSFNFAFRAKDDDLTIQAGPDDMNLEDKLDLLDEWAETLTPLKMRSNRRRFDNKTVFIDPAPLNPYTDNIDSYIGKMTIIQV